MTPTRYHVVTEMVLSSTPGDVRRTLEDVNGWPRWWKWAHEVASVNGEAPGAVGARYRNRVRTPMGYGFTYVTEIVDTAEGRIELDSYGDLEGTGLFVYEPTAKGASTSSSPGWCRRRSGG
ncbi:MAG: hypothetical protein ACLGHX_08655 [Acidimicrobiia bacterium]